MEKVLTIEDVLNNITAALQEDGYAEKPDPSVFTGLGGPLLYFSYLYMYSKDPDALLKSSGIVNELVSLCARYKLGPSMERGLSGVGWVIQHLMNLGILDDEALPFLQNLDNVLTNSIQADLKKNRYDYFTGLVGKGAYFLERSRANDVTAHLDRVFKALMDMSESDEYGITWQDWYSFERDNKDDKAYSLGLSHGIPAIIMFLCEVYKLGINKPTVEDVIRKAISWISHFKRNCGTRVFFPTNIVNYTEVYPESEPERLAWCHGDLGLSAAIIYAGRVLSDTSMLNLGESLAASQVDRFDRHDTGVVDAELCHGSAGVALLFKTIDRYLGSNKFTTSHEYWLRSTLSLASPGEGLGGYRTWRGPEHGGWVNDPGFLEGISGIGLFLMSEYYKDEDPGWLRLLLLFKP
jgi:lantibiotic biosynthesis protein